MMSRNDYLNEAFKLFNEGKISDSAYDAILMNVNNFTEDNENEEDYE
jgi:hypothetical protein